MPSRKPIPTAVRIDRAIATVCRAAASRERRPLSALIRDATREFVERRGGFIKPDVPDIAAPRNPRSRT